MNRVVALGLLLALGLGLALRLPYLAQRPMHNDEGVNGIRSCNLLDRGHYQYDPNEHHGPSLFYATLAFAKLTGIGRSEALTESELRWVTVLFAMGLILLLPLVTDGLGKQSIV